GTFTLATLGTLNRDTANPGFLGISGTLELTGLTLDTSHGAWELPGGTIVGGTVTTALHVPGYGPIATLQDVTLGGTPDIPYPNGGNVSGAGLRLCGGAITVEGGASLVFTSSQTLVGTGTVNLNGGSIGLSGSGHTLTIGAGVTVQGNNGSVDVGGNTLVN